MKTHELKIKVDMSEDWEQAIKKSCPDTWSESNIWKVGDQYPAQKGVVESDIVLVNYPEGIDFDVAVKEAKKKGLHLITPREIFAIQKEYPTLHKTLGVDYMYIVGTEECTFEGYRRACYVWWFGSGRWAYLYDVRRYGDSSGWFAFRKSELGTKNLESFEPGSLDLNSAIALLKENGYTITKQF
jgi:hypothetical protein